MMIEECRDILISQEAILDYDKTTVELKKLDQELQKEKKVYVLYVVDTRLTYMIGVRECMYLMHVYICEVPG